MSHHHAHHHCHHHGHSHGSAGDTRRLIIALGIIASFAVIEIVGGLVSGSLALLADAGHMVTDGMAIALALVARQIATRKPTAAFPFGQQRAQVLAAFTNGLALLVLIAFLLFESFERFMSPQDIDVGIMMSVAALGLLANFAAFAVLHGGDTDDVNMRGALLHVLGDILGSVAAIVSALIIAGTGFLAADPIVTLIVCALLVKSAWQLIKETSIVLLEGKPDHVDCAKIESKLLALPHVVNVHALRVWMITPQHTQATLHVQVDENFYADETMRAVKRLMRDEFDIEHTTVQMETYTVMSRDKGREELKVSCPDHSIDSGEPAPTERSHLH